MTFVVCGYRIWFGLHCSLGDVRAGRELVVGSLRTIEGRRNLA